jgi:hypothetical protein
MLVFFFFLSFYSADMGIRDFYHALTPGFPRYPLTTCVPGDRGLITAPGLATWQPSPHYAVSKRDLPLTGGL